MGSGKLLGKPDEMLDLNLGMDLHLIQGGVAYSESLHAVETWISSCCMHGQLGFEYRL